MTQDGTPTPPQSLNPAGPLALRMGAPWWLQQGCFPSAGFGAPGFRSQLLVLLTRGASSLSRNLARPGAGTDGGGTSEKAWLFQVQAHIASLHLGVMLQKITPR